MQRLSMRLRATIRRPQRLGPVILRHAFIPPDNARLANLAGNLDAHLRTIEAAFDVKIQRRNESFKVEGAKGRAERAVVLLQHLYGRAARPIGAEEVELAILESMSDAPARIEGEPLDGERADVDLKLRTRRADLAGRTPNQVAYLRNILGHDVTYWRMARSLVPVALTIGSLRRRLRLPDGTPPPSLGDVLGDLPPGLDLAIDAKASAAVAPAIDLLSDAGLVGRAALWVRRERAVADVARLAPSCERALLADAPTSEAARVYIDRAAECGATAVSLHHRVVDRPTVDVAHARSLTVYAWVTQPDGHERVLGAGVDGVVTDWPALARSLVG